MPRSHSRLTMLFAAGLGLVTLAGCSPAPPTPGAPVNASAYSKICLRPAHEGDVSTPITVEEFKRVSGIDLAGSASGAGGGHTSVEPVCIGSNGHNAYAAVFLSPNKNDVSILYNLAIDADWNEDVPPGDSAARTYAQLKGFDGIVQINWVSDLAVDSPGLGLSGPATWVLVNVGNREPSPGPSGATGVEKMQCSELFGSSWTDSTDEEFKEEVGFDLSGIHGGPLSNTSACKSSEQGRTYYQVIYLSPNPEDVLMLYERALAGKWVGTRSPQAGSSTAELSRGDDRAQISWVPDIIGYAPWLDPATPALVIAAVVED